MVRRACEHSKAELEFVSSIIRCYQNQPEIDGQKRQFACPARSCKAILSEYSKLEKHLNLYHKSLFKAIKTRSQNGVVEENSQLSDDSASIKKNKDDNRNSNLQIEIENSIVDLNPEHSFSISFVEDFEEKQSGRDSFGKNKSIPTASYEKIGCFIESNMNEKDLSVLKEEIFLPDELDFIWLQKKRESDEIIELSLFCKVFKMLNHMYLEYISEGKYTSVHNDEQTPCIICGETQTVQSNLLVKCYLCQIPVHQDCYGITYIPLGPWLCQKCVIIPNKNPKCELCPNLGGAYKKTVDGKWCHVNCALWIPECGFSRPIYLGPIDYLSEIPETRFKMSCTVCHLKNCGANIQCYKQSCYTSFHVTCALKNNFYMKIEIASETQKDGTVSYSMRKSAFCDAHSPNISTNSIAISENSYFYLEKNGSSKINHRKLPLITMNYSKVYESFKTENLDSLVKYWKVRKFLLNGLNLVESRMVDSAEKNMIQNRKILPKSAQELHKILELTKLIVEREKQKKKLFEDVKYLLYEKHLEKIDKILEMIDFFDIHKIFKDSVDPNVVKGYLTIVKDPIDCSLIRSKVRSKSYSFEELKADFILMIDNCLKFNPKGNFYNMIGQRISLLVYPYIIESELDCELDLERVCRFLENYLFTPPQKHLKRKRASSLQDILPKKRAKYGEITLFKFYWCKAAGIPWFPGLAIDPNNFENTVFDEIRKPDKIVCDAKPPYDAYLIVYIDNKYLMQWVQPQNMIEMFTDNKIDQEFINAKYPKAAKSTTLMQAYLKSKEIDNKYFRNIVN